MDLFVTGEIEPASGAWFIDDTIVLGDPDSEGPVWRIGVRNSRMIVDIVNEVVQDRDTFLFAHVRQVAQACADALGFRLGLSLTIRLVSVLWEDGRVGFLQGGWPQLADHERTIGVAIPRDEIFSIVSPALKNPFLRHALADLQQGIERHEDTAFYCYRAIESCRQVFVDRDDDSADRKRSWSRLHRVCGTNADDFAQLTQHATPRRHGGFGSPMSHEDRFQYMRLARKVFELVANHVQTSTARAGSPTPRG